jgi:hypothetical protein
MASRCCDNPDLTRLLHLAQRGVPHGHDGHEFIYDYELLFTCSACSGGLVESHSHDCFAHYEDEPWDLYWWWRIEPADMPLVLEVAGACPSSLDPDCECPVHHGLGGVNRSQDGGRTPPGLPHGVESPHGKADIPRVRVEVVAGTPRWGPQS